jgi:hypothetical protein
MTVEALFDASYMDDSTYPNLGFNPAPGVPADVEELEGVLSRTTQSMDEAGRLLGEMRDVNSGVWVGDAADAFRSHFNDKLVTDLDNAQQSLTEAVGTIQNWYKDLTGFKQTAQSLDQEAAAAREALANAQQELSQAQSNPDLGLIHDVFSDPQAVQDAQSAYDQATSALNDAQAAEQQAQDDLNSILKRAQQLSQETESAARNYASQLENATKGLAPHKPGMFSRMFSDITGALKSVGDWIEAHANVIHSILSTISAIAGLVALCTPPPIDLVAGGIALAASAGAFAMDLANPKTRDAIGGLLTGHFTMANIKAAAGAGLDLAGAIPGVGSIGEGLKGAKAAEEAGTTVIRGFDIAKSVPSLAKDLTGTADEALQASVKFADNTGKIANIIHANAHALSLPVSLGIGAVTKVVNLGRDADNVFKVSDEAAQNIELLWKTRGVASSLYHDAKEAF